MLCDRYEGRTNSVTPLRDDFADSLVGGSAFVFSIVTDEDIPLGACIEDDRLVVMAEREVYFSAIVAGINRHFPDWDMPKKSDEARDKSWAFWAQEWR